VLLLGSARNGGTGGKADGAQVVRSVVCVVRFLSSYRNVLFMEGQRPAWDIGICISQPSQGVALDIFARQSSHRIC
jgi:hypothetical protein